MFRYVLLVVFLIILPQVGEAYNFLYIHPTTGEPIGWEPGSTITYYLDPGPIGNMTNEQGKILVEEAIKVWEEASPYADVPKFEFGGYLSEDVNETNYQKYVSNSKCYTDAPDSCESDAQKNLQTVVIFDQNGKITNKLCPIGGCSAVAGARVFSGSSSDPGNIVQGIVVLYNLGGASGGSNTKGTVNKRVGTIVHELGHLLGLAHTSVNEEIVILNESENYHYLSSMIDQFAAASKALLNPDDIAGISVLYPSEIFASETVTIKGQILKSDSSPMPHVSVIVRNVNDPLCEVYSFLTARSCEYATSSLCEGYSDAADYQISGLPSGSYTVEVEEVSDDNLAQTLAPGLVDPFIYGDAEFWNEGDIADESNTISSVMTLAAGETRENVDIILNRSEVTDDRIKYIPLSTFTLGPDTRCPKEPPVDYAELAGIEEFDTPTGTSSGAGGSGCSLIR